jgi:hypothetical protein
MRRDPGDEPLEALALGDVERLPKMKEVAN